MDWSRSRSGLVPKSPRYPKKGQTVGPAPVMLSVYLEEFRARYVHGTRSEDIRVLAEVLQPGILVVLPVDDPGPPIRHWMAKNARDRDLNSNLPLGKLPLEGGRETWTAHFMVNEAVPSHSQPSSSRLSNVSK